MIPFEEVYRLASRSGSESAFNKQECRALYDLIVNNVKSDGLVVEIGIQFGRSTTVIGLLAKEIGFKFVAIDNWHEDVSKEAKNHVENFLIKELGLPIDLVNDDSQEVAKDFVGNIDLIHIDGDHNFEGVLVDCKEWLPKVKLGGFACFDDYGHESLMGVYFGVWVYMSGHNEWQFIKRYGNKLGIFQRKL